MVSCVIPDYLARKSPTTVELEESSSSLTSTAECEPTAMNTCQKFVSPVLIVALASALVIFVILSMILLLILYRKRREKQSHEQSTDHTADEEQCTSLNETADLKHDTSFKHKSPYGQRYSSCQETRDLNPKSKRGKGKESLHTIC